MQAATDPVAELHEVFTDQNRLVGQPVGGLRAGRVQQQSRRLNRAAGYYEQVCLGAVKHSFLVCTDGSLHPVVIARLQPDDLADGIERTVAAGQRLGHKGDICGALVQAWATPRGRMGSD